MRRASRFMSKFFNTTAVVYTQDATGGRYSVVNQDELPVRKFSLSANPRRGDAPLDRGELSNVRVIAWPPPYAPPSEFVQFEIDGERWQATRGSFQDFAGTDAETVYSQCLATRQDRKPA